MANTKISALTAATTPLAGTEVLPIVQSGATVKVANNDLRPKQIQSNATSGVLQVAGPAAAATRVMTTPDANFTAARTDASQTFTGAQTFTGVGGVTINKSAAGGTASLVLANSPSGDGVGRINIVTSSAVTNWSIDANTVTGGELNITPSTAGGGSTFTTPAWTFLSNSDVKLQVGNIIQGTAAKGVNFTANTPAAGMTSQLLNWYEEGTWTPAVSGMTITNMTGTYTRMGNVVVLVFSMDNSTVSGTPNWEITGIPFTNGSKRCCAGVAYNDAFNEASTTTLAVLSASGTTISLLNMSATGGWNESQITTGSGRYISFVLTYRI